MEYPTIVQPIIIEESMGIEIFQTEEGVPLLKISLHSLDCAIWLTLDAGTLLGNVASRIAKEYDQSKVQ